MAKLLTTLIVLTASFAIAACGGSQDKQRDAARERVAANASLLTIADLPSSWTEADVIKEPVPSNCPSVKAARAAVSARATTPNFDHEPTGQVTHTIYLYEDEEQARKIYAGIVTPATRKCLGSGVRKRIATEAEDVDVGGVRTRALKIDRVGDATSGARVTLGYGTTGVHFRLSADLIFVREGRGLSSLVLVDETGFFDKLLRERLIGKAQRKLRAALVVAEK